jgi:hypothetical protein
MLLFSVKLRLRAAGWVLDLAEIEMYLDCAGDAQIARPLGEAVTRALRQRRLLPQRWLRRKQGGHG